MSGEPYEPTPSGTPILPPARTCPHCGKQLPEVALPATGREALVSKAPARLAETARIDRGEGKKV